MSLKTLSNKITAKIGRQMLVAQKHSPTMLIGAGVIGFGATVVLACRATLKVSDILEEGEKEITQVEETADDGEEAQKRSFGVKVQIAVKIAKLYAPAVLVGAASVGAMTGSYVILKKRNAAITAAYAIVDESFKRYRARVIEDQGKEKDLEYQFGTAEREIVEEGPNGPEPRTLRGLDQKKIKADAKRLYARIFDETHPSWSDIPNQNQLFIQSVQNHANEMLRVLGKVYLNDVYEMLGYDKTDVGQVVGWVSNPEEGEGDGYICFGIWSEGIFEGKEWVTGHKDGILLNFNVDGIVLDLLKKK